MPKILIDADREVGERIQMLRKAKGLSQTALGKAIGVTFQQVQKYERGLNRVGAGRLQRIAELLEVPVATLYGADGENGGDGIALFQTPHAGELLRLFEAMPARCRGPLLTIARALSNAREAGEASARPEGDGERAA
ncbi:helix-turn-helix domain-containing protein [Methylobacterium sp. JK268]